MPAPFLDEEFTFTQPDGSSIRLRGSGNQFAAVFETLDGHTVVRDPDSGYYHYADLSDDGAALLPTGPRAGEADTADADRPRHVRPRTGGDLASYPGDGGEERTPRWRQCREERRAAVDAGDALGAPPPTPATGAVVGLCLLVRFPDVAPAVDRDEVDAFCNAPGYSGFGNNGSVRDYFLDVSGGRLDYRSEVIAFHTAAHPRDYYTDESQPQGKRAQELIREALDALMASGFDPSVLTVDGGGFVLALNVFYAGTRVNHWAQGLWPHSSALAQPYQAGAGRTFHDYQITDLGTQLTLRTFCHENGHMVCDYPDLYDYDQVPGTQGRGVGNYCLMCYGGSDTNPVQINAYLKNASGWTATLTDASPGAEHSIAAGANDFVVHRRDATEYFLLENRRRAGRDAALPDEGLLVWHVDERGDNSFQEMTPAKHYELSLEQADGRFDLEHNTNVGDDTDLFGAPQATTFGTSSTPDSRWWNGSASGLEIVDVSAPGQVMTIKIG